MQTNVLPMMPFVLDDDCGVHVPANTADIAMSPLGSPFGSADPIGECEMNALALPPSCHPFDAVDGGVAYGSMLRPPSPHYTVDCNVHGRMDLQFRLAHQCPPHGTTPMCPWCYKTMFGTVVKFLKTQLARVEPTLVNAVDTGGTTFITPIQVRTKSTELTLPSIIFRELGVCVRYFKATKAKYRGILSKITVALQKHKAAKVARINAEHQQELDGLRKFVAAECPSAAQFLMADGSLRIGAKVVPVGPNGKSFADARRVVQLAHTAITQRQRQQTQDGELTDDDDDNDWTLGSVGRSKMDVLREREACAATSLSTAADAQAVSALTGLFSTTDKE